MGKGEASTGGALYEKIFLSYACVVIWVSVSMPVIVFNKYILDRNMYNWPFPISLTMIHMGFCSSLAFLIIRVLKLVEPIGITWEIYALRIMPIGALYSLTLWFSNSAYIYLSISSIQMLKALMPVAVYSIGVLFQKEVFSRKTMANMVCISLGVGIAAYGKANFSGYGVLLQLGSVACEAMRLVLIQILLTSKGISLDPITILYYVAPCCFVFLSIPWFLVEFPILKATPSFYLDYQLFGANSLCAFALNLAVFLVVGINSALTMNVAGVVKDWLMIAFSYSVIMVHITTINLVGYGLAFVGVCFYNFAKLQGMKEHEMQNKIGGEQQDEELGILEAKLERDDQTGLGRETDA